MCRRGSQKSVVCDPDRLLSQSDADTLDGLANFVESGTHGFKKMLTCPSKSSAGPVGVQVAVAIFYSMATNGISDKEKRAYQFAKDLHDRWGVGDVDCQNGVVIVVAVKDRAMGFSIGAGAKHIFKQEMLPGVMGVMKPKLRNEEYGQALVVGVTAVGNIVSGAEPPKLEPTLGFSEILGGLQMVAFLSLMGCFACAGRRKRGRYQRCKQLLEKMDRERQQASRNEYIATSCPICLEDFPAVKQNATSTGTASGSSAVADSVAVNVADGGTEPVRTVRAGLLQTAAGRAGVSTGADSGEDTVRTLPCGHKFHEKCVVTWFSGTRESNRQCPICRQSIHEGDNRMNYGSLGGWEVYDPEYSFRMQRTHYYYPDFVTWSMINSWERDRYETNRPMATSSSFAAVDPVVVAAAARASGSGGSSFSFGGGSSAGGGGGGGSW